ncbi:DUF3344 domain-containing protein [Streptomyces sp. MUM 203J]|uniref:DUF3344 domain-containing protein n=1 Tax=Streptomyces sp. MUM 203J TaxID=2791990 RepID=UPI001F03A59C|nr:DUF3344 domain-containing protein [Streptomyces sp. MUM 203J]MCH0543213.1 DUF3344 domain-containing protein [Streptomyces sp. MUM 203J]
MRNPLVPAVRRGLVCLLSCAALCAVLPAAGAAPNPEIRPAPRMREKPRIPFIQRYYAVQRGGMARAANAGITCRSSPACASAQGGERRGGGGAANHRYDMFYTDVDDDPNTFNSSRAELVLPRGAQVTYARLYWGGNLRVSEQKAHKDNGRVLIAEPGGAYKELLADSVIGHRTGDGADAFQASADVTELVRDTGAGIYTVAQINIAMGQTGVGAWGGWTLVAAYTRKGAPLRHLSLWDAFETLGSKDSEQRVNLGRMRIPVGGYGRLGIVAYDGDRGIKGDSVTFEPHGTRRSVPLSDPANSADDVFNSTITDAGRDRIRREPAHRNTLGYDSDVLDLRRALVSGADDIGVRVRTAGDTVWLGALFLEADAG